MRYRAFALPIQSLCPALNLSALWIILRFLVSGSGDSRVRLWEITSGSLLDTCEVSAMAGHLESDGSDDGYLRIIDLCTVPDSTLVAVAIQNLQGIMLVSCNLPDQSLSVAKVVCFMGENFIPTSLGNSSSSGLLWMVTGASNLPGFDHPALSRVKVISGFKESGLEPVEYEPNVLEDNDNWRIGPDGEVARKCVR